LRKLAAVQKDSPHLPLLRWLLALSAALIAYGSLYPFDFFGGPDDVLDRLELRRPTRGDLVANLLLYLPIGAGMVLAFPWRRRLAGVALGTLAGALLSLAIELLQSRLPTRDSSLTDVLLNTVSAAAGGIGAAWLATLLQRWPAGGGAAAGGRRLAPLLVVALWLASRTTPFIPTLDWQKWKDALKPLLRWEDWSLLSTARYALGWLVVVAALRALATASRATVIWLLLVAVTLAAQVAVIGRVLRPPEFVGLGLAAVGLPLLQVMPPRQLAAGLAAGMAALIAWQGLAPFDIVLHAAQFRWLPFEGSLGGSMEQNLLAMLEKGFLYGSLLWLLTGAGLTTRGSLLLVVPLLAGIEWLQRWLPGRSPEITDPLLALALGWLFGRIVPPAVTSTAAQSMARPGRR
jgi:VanZ family protein